MKLNFGVSRNTYRLRLSREPRGMAIMFGGKIIKEVITSRYLLNTEELYLSIFQLILSR